MDILNYFLVSENLATSGQPSKEQFKQIAEAGYDVLINLAMPDHENSIEDQGRIVTSYGMTYIHIPVPFDAPTDAQFEEYANYLLALENRKVWVHCIVNARVSAFTYRYLRDVKKAASNKLENPILAAWLPNMDNTWKEFIG